MAPPTGLNCRNRIPPLEPFEQYEHSKDVDPSFPSLLKEGTKISDIAVSIGAKVTGVQLSQLDDKGKDELSLLLAQKKVVVFHDQDFATIPIQQAVDFAGYFGRLHVHPVSGAARGFPQLHMHSDVSYELQPHGTTMLSAIDVIESGGVTLFVNQVKAYERLTPGFCERLAELKVVHSAYEQAQTALGKGGQLRQDPITSVHPLMSDGLLNFIYHHIALSHDVQCRFKWSGRSVVVWDNRVTAHSGLMDWKGPRYRYIARLAAQAEVPTEYDPMSLTRGIVYVTGRSSPIRAAQLQIRY
ncbi:hypothetical protein BDP81DRAFT_477332 [Colletotrichum phormii]|uniref:TauD/TfdA-like domain-containing protein n=1 Tax=Colletotrichum phormii TaxID=359342 RepID=A0AAJ0A358_9PEZI|nr:uncharacterized protein BDP81DRAFT_477332 [Colletotrichum phormii]KAK1655614.1 hypothetical protein BDP81DRAFT_477332 [Colletotrichum phormii]